jgi:peptidyl-prolyl cis-trans isomerase C
MLRSVILVSATLAMAAQTPAPEAPKEAAVTAAPARPEAPKAKAAPKPPADPVLATIGKEAIRQSDFELFLEITMTDQQRMQMQFIEGARAQYLNRFLEFKALAAKARQEGLQKRPDHAKKLAVMDMQLLIQALMDKDGPALQAKLNLKDEEVKAYFDAHPDKFKTPESFSARHILIGTRAIGDKKALTDTEAKAKADKVLAEIKGGKSFDAAAKEYSDDPGSKDKGGLYEDTAFGKFVPEFDQAVRSQPIGKVGEPVKTMYGYHLIEVEKITPAVAQTFDAAKDTAREQATAERQEQVMQAYIDRVKKEVGFKSSVKLQKAAAE